MTNITDRLALPYPDLDEGADGPGALQALAEALDGMAPVDQGALASRPVSTAGSPGIIGRFYRTTDQTPNRIWFDHGTGWVDVTAAHAHPQSDVTGLVDALAGLLHRGLRVSSVEGTATVEITGNFDGGGMTTILTIPEAAYDGTKVRFEFFAPAWEMTDYSTGRNLWLFLLMDGVSIGAIGKANCAPPPSTTIGPLFVATEYTPAAGDHTFVIGGMTDKADDTAYIRAGAGGSGSTALRPMEAIATYIT